MCNFGYHEPQVSSQNFTLFHKLTKLLFPGRLKYIVVVAYYLTIGAIEQILAYGTRLPSYFV